MDELKYNVQNLKPWHSQWRNGQTKVIRVPIALENQILDYARRLDAGEVVQDKPSVEHLVNTVLSDPAVTRSGRDRGSCRRALNAFLEQLNSTGS
jgi:hypothetical protein